jgi:hypothetical protein
MQPGVNNGDGENIIDSIACGEDCLVRIILTKSYVSSTVPICYYISVPSTNIHFPPPLHVIPCLIGAPRPCANTCVFVLISQTYPNSNREE